MKIRELFEIIVAPDWQTDPEQFIASTDNDITTVKFKNGVLTFKDRLWIRDEMFDDNGELLFPIQGEGVINLCSDKMKNFKNFPEHLNGFGWLGALRSYEDYNPKFSFDYCPKVINGNVMFQYCSLNYSGIHKHIKSLNGSIAISAKYVGPILGFLKIKDLNQVNGLKSTGDSVSKDAELGKALFILNTYIKGDKNVLNCQEELINNGLEEFAKL